MTRGHAKRNSRAAVRVGVGVAANVAANVCGVTVQVGVIARQIAQTGQYSCENETTSRFVQILR